MHVKTLCLGALCFGDATGYDIKKLFEAAFNHFHTASFGSIYPALRQLQDAGLVTHSVEPGDKHPDRKLFRVTDEGRDAFLKELEATPASEQVKSEFMVLMFFAHLLPTEVLARKLDEMEARYRKELNYLESLSGCRDHTAGIEYTVEQGIRVYRAKLGLLRERRAKLLADHRRLPASWTGAEAVAAGAEKPEESA